MRTRAARHNPLNQDLGGPAATRDPRTTARLSARVASTVTALRAGDRAAAHRPEPGLRAAEPLTPASTLAVLREAVEAGTSVWIGYVDNHGTTQERVVDPVRVEAGQLSAYDHRTEDVRSFAVHRITAVRPLEHG
jgi:predicted DNA-binding transcriptional regulator YafY